jgi:hypothetical protein
MSTPGAPLICYDLPTVSRFFRSVALAVAFQRHTSTEWVTYKDSTVLNAVYTVLFWKEPPGAVEVKQSSRQSIERATDELHQQFLFAWIEKLYQGGPSAGNEYVERMARLRENAREAVNDLFRDAARINAEVANQTRDAIVALARIRLAATVGVAVIGGAAGVAFALSAAGGAAAAGGVTVFGLQAGASATTFGVAGFGYSATNSIIKTWEQGPTAKVAAVSLDTGKAVASEVGGGAAGGLYLKAMEQQARSGQIISSAEGQIRKYSARLADETLRRGQMRKARNIVGKSTQQIATESANLARAGRTAQAARLGGAGIPVVFAAWDIIDAWGDYQDTMKAVR